MISSLLPLAGKILDRVIPDPAQKQAAKMEMARLQMEGETKDLEVSMSAIVMEAKSTDPWTSRARPSFMYVIYILLLTAIPMGILHAFSPEAATNMVTGMRSFWEAIPTELYTTFTVGYLGYTGARSYDKKKTTEAGKS